jgi:hypothetical protein
MIWRKWLSDLLSGSLRGKPLGIRDALILAVYKGKTKDAETGTRTRTGLPPTVFKTVASAIPPFPHVSIRPGTKNGPRLRSVPGLLERKMGFEPTTFSLARRCSTTEPLPQCAATLAA